MGGSTYTEKSDAALTEVAAVLTATDTTEQATAPNTDGVTTGTVTAETVAVVAAETTVVADSTTPSLDPSAVQS